MLLSQQPYIPQRPFCIINKQCKKATKMLSFEEFGNTPNFGCSVEAKGRLKMEASRS